MNAQEPLISIDFPNWILMMNVKVRTWFHWPCCLKLGQDFFLRSCEIHEVPTLQLMPLPRELSEVNTKNI